MRYFWLKLPQDFFDKEEIKIINSMPDGGEVILIYLRLLLKSIQTDGQLYYRDSKPYTKEMLAAILNTGTDQVTKALETLKELNLIEQNEDGALVLQEYQNMVGSETEWAEKKRKYRNKTQEGQEEDAKGQCPTELEKELETELEKDTPRGFDEDSPQVLVAKEMEKILLKAKPDSKRPTIQAWAKDIDYLIRIDKKNPQDIIDLFEWTQNNEFWVANIRSARKLREKWDTLELQRGRAKPKDNVVSLGELYEKAMKEEQRQ